MSTAEVIRIVGAEHNNLKNLSLDIPLHELLVVTGVSGSGKSSLAFDTLYAEGQRRYVESFSAYARQFLERMDKPQVEHVEGIPPAIAIDQSNPIKNARSTVGTMTELTDHVRLLFAKMGQLHCQQCDEPVQRSSASGIVAALLEQHGGQTAMICFPYARVGGRTTKALRLELQRLGFTRLLIDGQVMRLDAGLPALAKDAAVEVVVDRLPLQADRRARLLDSLEQAMRFGQGRVTVHLPPAGPRRRPGDEPLRFSQHLHCPTCDLTYRDPAPNLFSFNSPLGACQVCQGFGRTIDIDLDLIIPDRRKSLVQGAIKPWSTKATRHERRIMLAFCADHGIPTDAPFASLSDAQQAMIIDGHGEFFGLRGWFAWLETRTYRMHVRIFLARYRSYVTCTECGGTRLKSEALLTRIRGRTISDVYALSVGACADFFEELAASAPHDEAITLLLGEIRSRLGYLVAVGLDYLTLDRQSRTLSGGEVQRVNLTTALGSSLVNTLYILDEPSIGLHPRDSRRLVRILHHLKANRNTIVVVEHDPEIIRESDRILDLGPGAGERGGEIVYFGPAGGIGGAQDSLTGQYLDGRRRIPVPKRRRQPRQGHAITMRGASQNNLKAIDVRIPLGLLVCVTGVSGSGKSTLVHEVLYNGLQKARGVSVGAPGACRELTGGEGLDDVALVDQAPVGRTPRANPATYVKAWDHIRRLFAATPAARERGLSASTFSFNTAGGRCETCQGSGFEKIDMQFLSDIFVTCPDCNGARFRREVLEVTCKGRSIAEVLQLTVAEALTFFDDTPALVRSLQPLRDVGLDYVRLGQPLNTLSGGESQRLKLAFHMGQHEGGRRLLIFDEPTTGLHFDDIATLLRAFERLLAQGHSLLVIEHNMEVIKSADYLIDLGPEGGDAGGYLVATGTPEQVSRCDASHTGRFLRAYLEKGADAYRNHPHPNPLPEGEGTGLGVTALHEGEGTGLGVTALHEGEGTGLGVAALPEGEGTGLGVTALPEGEGTGLGVTALHEGEGTGLGVTALHEGEGTGLGVAALPEGEGTGLGVAALPQGEGTGRGVAAFGETSVGAANGAIAISGARHHNLKNVEVDIPRDRFVVVTGLSGSGKSTLAFDIVFAEGQRRYMESLSAYARQFLQPLSKPDVDSVRGVPPTVAIEQRVTRGGHNSTVATVTEVHHYLRLLYAKIGVQHCPACDLRITSQTGEQILVRLLTDYKGEAVTLLAPAVRGRKGFHKDVLAQALRNGASEVRVDGERMALEPQPQLDRYREHDIDVVVGAAKVATRQRRTVQDLLERALRLGQGACIALSPGHAEHLYSLKFFCPACNIGFDDLDPRLFSFNSRQGACPACHGAGVHDDFDPALLVPDGRLSLRQGALALYNDGPFTARHRARLLRDAERMLGIDADKPFADLRARQRQAFWHGSSGRGGAFEGILPHCRRLFEDSSRERVRRHLAQFTRQAVCEACKGARLRPQARAVRVNGRTIVDIAALSVEEAAAAVPQLVHGDRDRAITATLLPEITARLQCMQEVGLGYLTLDRRSDTLSGGEAQRLRLAAQLGSNLRGVCYVLDEPTIGLHPRDNARLLATLQRLKAQGNSIVVVEHDEATMRSADHVIDLGPGGGRQGGHVVAAGPPQYLAQHAASLTGRYLRNGAHPGPVSRQRNLNNRPQLTVRSAREHNLKGIDVSFPLETFIAVTGVSGSGKSTLVEHTLYPALRQRLGGSVERVGAHRDLDGADAVRRVLQVDHTPIGKSPRSNPATYVGFYDTIRRLLAQTPEARLRGYTPGRFSFNVKGGRCDACSGQGQRKVEMNFLPDVFVPCETCRGQRFSEETLEITYGDRNAAAILALTVTEAVDAFASVASVHRPLQIMRDAGLGYLTLGQPSNTLSGGEAQRIKLAYELNRSAQAHTLYILDEPTTGLHPADVEKLLHVLQSLVDSGNTVLVIEHNLEVIRQADYVIDLGPEGGRGGGEVVVAGPPEHLLAHPQASHTARFLRQYVEGSGR